MQLQPLRLAVLLAFLAALLLREPLAAICAWAAEHA